MHPPTVHRRAYTVHMEVRGLSSRAGRETILSGHGSLTTAPSLVKVLKHQKAGFPDRFVPKCCGEERNKAILSCYIHR